MPWLLFGLSVAAELAGMRFGGQPDLSIHEALAAVTCFMAAAIFFTGGAIVEAINRQRPTPPPLPPGNQADREREHDIGAGL